MTAPTTARAREPKLQDDQGEALRRVEAYLRHEQQRRRLEGAAGRVERVEEAGGAGADTGVGDEPSVDACAPGVFAYEYDAVGDLVAIREANGLRRYYHYDARRRLVTVELEGERQSEIVARYCYDEWDRIESVERRGCVTAYHYDESGRVASIGHGDDEVSVYRYDEAGRVVLARTSQVTTCWRYDAAGRTAAIEQALDGVTLRVELGYDEAGRLATLRLPGGEAELRYTWDDRGRPLAVTLPGGGIPPGSTPTSRKCPTLVGAHLLEVVRFAYDDAARKTTIVYGNGVTGESVAGAIDGRPARLEVRRGEERLLARALQYDALGQIAGDGERLYSYDRLGRLVGADGFQLGPSARSDWQYEYDALDNLRAYAGPHGSVRFACDQYGRVESAVDAAGHRTQYTYDGWGRLSRKEVPLGTWEYRYDDGGNLREVRWEQTLVAAFLYDHKGRLVWAEVAGEVERYLYGDADELLAVTDETGCPRRLLLRTPLGVHAEVRGVLGEGEVLFRHCDERGTLRLVTDGEGFIRERFAYECYGRPDSLSGTVTGSGAVSDAAAPCFTGRDWYAAIGLYYFGARWYDPEMGRFLTPDTYTGAPDDVRLVNPLHRGAEQVRLRGQILGEWLKQPRVRNATAFCANDPVGHVDPNGHWAFGGVLLMLLGAIWTLPTTLFGILVEITCLVGEVIRWLVWLFSFGHASWETPGFDAASSGRLNAFALVFTGGWLGSFSGLLGITFGNVFFVYKEWEKSPYIAALPDPIFPPAYEGRVSIPRQRMLYEHELRHTNQAGWFGPFYHFGLPLFGFYEWDLIVNGYRNAWSERDARAHAEP
jgi:RHS repeat-associated protein